MALTNFTRMFAAQARSLAQGRRVLIRLCLVLSTWNAPLPMVHAHEVNASRSGAVSIALLKHVHDFHEDAELAGENYLDWHIHWLFPSEWQAFPCHHQLPGSDGPNTGHHGRSEMSTGVAMPAKTAAPAPTPNLGKPVWLLQLVRVTVSQSPLLSQAAQNGFVPLTFLSSFDRSVSLCTLLGVWRC